MIYKITILLLLISANLINNFAQADVREIVETEKAFAKTAEEKDTKSAFLQFIADDGIIFQPDAVNGKTYWNSQDKLVGHLAWYPVFADISANGVLGYTTGPWNYSAKKGEMPTVFGDFITIWQKQPDGKYKFILDIGISHAKPENNENDWKTSSDKTNTPENKPPVSASSNLFYDTAVEKGLNEAYKMFAAENIRIYREGKLPILGKNAALNEIKKEKYGVGFGKKMTLQSAGDMAFSNVTYEFTKGNKVVEKGSTVQIWKFINGNWQIVSDIFHPTPEKKN